MRVMGAQTPDERLESRVEELMELRVKVDTELRRVRAAIRAKNRRRIGRPAGPRPPCGTEKGYQRHYREGEYCRKCRAAHSEHERNRAAAARLSEAS